MPPQRSLSLTDIIQLPPPGMNIPAAIRFTPDGRALTYLHSSAGSLVRELYRHPLDGGGRRLLISPPGAGVSETNISRAEQLRRERARQRALGITSYQWHAGTDRILIPQPDGLYIQDGADGTLMPLVTGGAVRLDPQFSPDGRWLSFVQDDELYVVPAAGGDPQQITCGARGSGRTHGLAEYIAQEELDRSRGTWWSPDSAFLAFTEVDETHIPAYRIMHLGKDELGDAAQEDHRYPFAGQPNARVRLGIVPRAGGDPVWMDLGAEEDIYLARVKWLPDGRLTAQLLNRAQSGLDLVVFDPQTGARTSLLREETAVWINLHKLFTPLPDGRFLWGSEKSGFQHLYLHAADGAEIRQLTSGDWMVEHIAGLDTKNGRVYFTATAPQPTERHLWVVSLDGGPPQQLTQGAGMHEVSSTGSAPALWIPGKR
jgi:dipeptidyl-peptidase-4